ncbi:rhodanese-like domain-containing protein [Cochleicola gelatinilyticus]|uniref:Rhodanese n=1 Tax=Cochleicola gelatinilyticus TaxID=1763537 RepID=A0A167IMJ5_9FLAO|nr:rhodanese-like domain-containing protein [Cochleicola gelatinilyticus]OAB79828.1 rhodanese [Cochleicola gelatinilyticus]
MRKLLIILFIFVSTATMAQKSIDTLLKQYNTRSIPYISVEELRMLQMNEAVVILDSREEEEFKISHIESSSFIGYTNFSSEEVSEKITNKHAPIIVYCSLGIRSEKIGEKLQKAGFTNVHNLYGGIFEWKNKNYPVIDSTGTETQKIHAFSKAWSKWLTEGEKVYNEE